MPEQNQNVVIFINCQNVVDNQDDLESWTGSYEFTYLVYDLRQNEILSCLEKTIDALPVSTEKLLDLQQSETAHLHDNANLKDILHQLTSHLDNEHTILSTFGSLPLRHFVHSHAVREKIKLHEKFFCYFDIKQHFKQVFPEFDDDDDLDLVKAAAHLNVSTPDQLYGLRFCRVLVEVMQQLPEFSGSPQTIQAQYSSIPSSADLVEDTVAKVRGFSSVTTDVKLARFFAGLNIESGGIVMSPVVSSHGRQTNEAYVRFTDKIQRDLALKRNGTKFGTRIMEVSAATIEEYSKVQSDQDNMYCVPSALENFLLLAAPPVVIIRMRGLPYNTKPSEIVTFFGDEIPVYRGTTGIFFVYHADKRPTGDAFVLFETSEQGKQALTKDRQTIGKRYVELFQTSRNEVMQVFARYSAPNTVYSSTVRPLRAQEHGTQNKNFSSNTKNIIRLRGLPYSATVQDILDFLSEFSKYVNPAGVHMVYNLQGRPSGDAFIELRSAEHAQRASELLHKKHIGERYIEVFQCSSSEMTFMLMYGIPSFRHHSTWINGLYSPRTPGTFSYPPASTTAYPTVSSPSTITPNCTMIPSSPTLSPRLFMTSPSPGYVTYSSPPYSVFNFPYPTTVDGANITHQPPVVSPTPYDSNTAVFFPGYQTVNDYGMNQMDPHFIPINPYLPPNNGYYPPTNHETDSRHIPAYVETYSG